MRRVLACLFILLALSTRAEAAQPTFTAGVTCQAANSMATISCTLTGVTAGRGIMLLVYKIGNTNTAVSSVVTDKSDTFTQGSSTPEWNNSGCPGSTGVCVYGYLVSSAVGGNTLVTVTMAATVTSGIVAIEVACTGGCASDHFSYNNFATSMGPNSVQSGELDTAANVALMSGCGSTTSMSTTTVPTGYTAVNDPGTNTSAAVKSDTSTAYTDELATWGFANSVTGACIVGSIANVTTASGPTSGSFSLLGVGK